MVAVIGAFLSYVFYRRSLRQKEPVWAIRSVNLVSDRITRMPGLRVLYQDTSVSNFTVTDILFWNRGRETIHREDIAAADPLRVVALGDTAVLDASIAQTNSVASSFACFHSSGKEALLKFDFVDRGHGVKLRILHTGTQTSDLELTGTIKGAEPLRKVHTQRGDITSRALEWVSLPILFILVSAPIAFAQVLVPGDKGAQSLVGFLGAIILGAVGFLLLAKAGRSARRRQLPPGLDLSE